MPSCLTFEAHAMRLADSRALFNEGNKIEIKTAVESLFSVKVTHVNTLVQRGKPRRMGRALEKRPNWKKAVVTLEEGSDIQFFDESKE